MSNINSLRNKVIRHIETQIQYSKLKPNQIINETMLCNELEVSRTPVREALIQLVADGVLAKVPHKGYTVLEFDNKQNDDVYQVIAVLEGLAVTLAMKNILPEDITKMSEIADKMDIAIKYKNYDEYYMLQEQFHEVYINKCDNQTVISILKSLKNGPIRQTYFSENFDKLFMVLAKSQEQHRRIIKLIEEKRVSELEQYLRDVHWKPVYRSMI